jgi:hypothetical protein
MPEAQRQAKLTLLALAAQTSTAPPTWHTEVGGHVEHSKAAAPAAAAAAAAAAASGLLNVPAWHSQSSALLVPRGAELFAGHSTRCSPAQKLSAGQTTQTKPEGASGAPAR